MNLHFEEKRILLGLLVCVLIAGVGISFAYYISGVTFSGSGSSTDMDTYKLVNVEYDAGSSQMVLEDAYPGKSVTKSFSVTLTPQSVDTVKYLIKLNIEDNTFEKCDDDNYNSITNNCIKDEEELIYTLKDENNTVIATGDLLEKTGSVELVTLEKNVSSKTIYNYSLEILFKNTNQDQNHNVNKLLNGSIKVEFAE